MAHGTRVNNTAYGISGGKCLVDGTAYGIKKGRTLIDGTGYDVGFQGETIVEITGSGNFLTLYVNLNDQKYYDPESLVFDAGQPVTLLCYLESNTYSVSITLSYNGEVIATGNRKKIEKEFDITGKNVAVAFTSLMNLRKIDVTEL